MPPTVTENQFRSVFPEFADKTAYPSAAIQFWLGIAQAQVNADAWKTSYAQGIYLFMAHQLVVHGPTQKDRKGARPALSGQVSSKAVGSVSVSYDTGSASEQGAGFYNLTNYGKQFWRLSRLFGAGSIQL